MAINAGNNLNSVAAPLKQALSTNYLDLAGTATKVGHSNTFQI